MENVLAMLRDHCEKYFETDNGLFCLGDSRKILKLIPSNSIDIIITDPPFGLNMDEYDDPRVFFDVEKEMYRVLKPNSWMLFYYAIKVLPNAFKLKLFKYKWMIVSVMPDGTHSKCLIGDNRYTPILVYGKGEPRIVHRRWDAFTTMGELPYIQEKGIPKQFKPTMTNALLLQMFTRMGDLVLDPFAGYGSIPFTCDVFGRRWIAIEIDPEKYSYAYELITNRRLPQTTHVEEQTITLYNFTGVDK